MVESNRTPLMYRFGAFEVVTRSGELRKFGARIKLQEKPLQILLMLLEHPGEIVDREDLRRRLWASDEFVDFDQSLNTAMKKLRQALGDSAAVPIYIETLARRGYRFLAPVDKQPADKQEIAESLPPAVQAPATGGEPKVSRPRGPRLWFAAALALSVLLAGVVALRRVPVRNTPAHGVTPRIESLVVLPLINLSHDPAQEYLAEGLTDALIGELAQIGALKVISRTSAVHYKGTHKLLPEIGKELHVDAVVEGTVQRSGDRLRLTAQLIEAATDRHLWAQSYERNLNDVLALEGELAGAIAQQIQIRITPQEKTQLTATRMVAADAYEAYLKGRFFWNKRTAEGLLTGLRYLKQAVALDSSYAMAYAGLADCYNMLSYYGGTPPAESFPKARAAAARALALDDNLAEAHAALGFCHLHYDWDWRGAEAEFKKALALNPGYANARHWYSHYLLAAGRAEESLLESRKALVLDPLNLSINSHVGHEYLYCERYDAAIDHLLKALELDPASARVHLLLGQAYEQKGNFGSALAELRRAMEQAPHDVQIKGALGHLYAVSGRKEDARRVLKELAANEARQHVGAYEIATLCAALGQADLAFEWLQHAFQERSEELIYLRVDPRTASLRGDTRFSKLIDRLGLHDVSQPSPAGVLH